jgi:cholesterol transport system auxiliary component
MLTGCGGGLLGGSAPTAFDLAAVDAFPRHGSAARGPLVVAEPTTLALLDSDRIAVRSVGDEVSYLPGALWSDKLPRLVQTRIVQSFENAHRLAAVGRQGDRLAATYQLLLDLRAFEIVASNEPHAQIEITAKILDERSGRIVAARVFTAAAPAAGIDGANAVAALNAALATVTRDLVIWTERLV